MSWSWLRYVLCCCCLRDPAQEAHSKGSEETLLTPPSLAESEIIECQPPSDNRSSAARSSDFPTPRNKQRKKTKTAARSRVPATQHAQQHPHNKNKKPRKNLSCSHARACNCVWSLGDHRCAQQFFCVACCAVCENHCCAQHCYAYPMGCQPILSTQPSPSYRSVEVGQSDEVKLAIDAEKATELESKAVEEVSSLYKDEADISRKWPLCYNTPRKATRKATRKKPTDTAASVKKALKTITSRNVTSGPVHTMKTRGGDGAPVVFRSALVEACDNLTGHLTFVGDHDKEICSAIRKGEETWVIPSGKPSTLCGVSGWIKTYINLSEHKRGLGCVDAYYFSGKNCPDAVALLFVNIHVAKDFCTAYMLGQL